MANLEHLAVLEKGVEAWNEWREQLGRGSLKDPIIPDFSYADLSGSYLANCNLSGANLSRANLSRTVLTNTSLKNADLSRTRLNASDLSGALLIGSQVVSSDVSNALMQDADLSFALFKHIHFSGVDLTGAYIGYTIFANVDFTFARGLDLVRHMGPSTIGLDTILRSREAISDGFLRSTGTPDTAINTIRTLMDEQSVQFHSCFISYSTKDQDFADHLYADLQLMGVRCWFAPHDVQGGRKLHEQIDQAIRQHDRVLLILSSNSMSSEWVKSEISTARKREVREQVRVLFPISLAPFEAIRDWKCFDADAGKDSAREIREYFLPDFSNWRNHESYQSAFERLVKDLQASANR